jgi:dTDP-glucose 4,6-dehydratase
MLSRGWEVLVLDNLVTGSEENIAHLKSNPKFRFALQDASRYIEVQGPVDAVLHFASPASPPDYLKLPIQTLKVGALGTHNTLGLALAKKARYLLASTSECYGDPNVSPQPARSVRRSEALRRSNDHGVSPLSWPGYAHCTDL